MSRDLPGNATLNAYELRRPNNLLNLGLFGKEADTEIWRFRIKVMLGNINSMEFAEILVNRRWRRHGLSKVIGKNVYDLARALKITEMTAHATISGAFVAAKLGFLPTKIAWHAVQRKLLPIAIEIIRRERIEGAEAIVAALNSPDPADIRSLIYIGDTSIRIADDPTLMERRKKLGDLVWKLLAESGADWEAVIANDDSEGWALFEKFVMSGGND